MKANRRVVAWSLLATASFVLAVLLAGYGLPGYSHRLHPLALRGASGLPWAMLFNAGAFLLPGVCLLLVAQSMRDALHRHGWSARIGLALAQLSALAYGAQGLLPMTFGEIDSPANRLHVLAWMLWWIAFVPAMLLLALGARRGALFASTCVLAGVLVPLLAVLAPIGLWVGLAQRLAFGLWFGWWLWAAWRLTRTSVSAAGSSPPAGT
ncbi:DUF998 domain-containing protein [Thermomonas paludicola]|uniref:DUF998 domain-containing protein n=1 Tax=Thermomonas paludicola TaxID=2884874 RepID=UPI0021146674|nr:DUF998 domain-containing protein [Thermomonas paludicola]